MRRAAQRGLMTAEMVIGIAILGAVMIPLAFAFQQDGRLCRAYYQRAIAMEIVDGEMEILAAGEWRAFAQGTQPYPVHAQSATNLPPGRFQLTVGPDRLRLEWLPAKAGRARTVVREVGLPPRQS